MLAANTPQTDRVIVVAIVRSSFIQAELLVVKHKTAIVTIQAVVISPHSIADVLFLRSKHAYVGMMHRIPVHESFI